MEGCASPLEGVERLPQKGANFLGTLIHLQQSEWLAHLPGILSIDHPGKMATPAVKQIDPSWTLPPQSSLCVRVLRSVSVGVARKQASQMACPGKWRHGLNLRSGVLIWTHTHVSFQVSTFRVNYLRGTTLPPINMEPDRGGPAWASKIPCDKGGALILRMHGTRGTQTQTPTTRKPKAENFSENPRLAA